MKPVGVMVVSQEEVDEARQAYQQSCLKLADNFLAAKVTIVLICVALHVLTRYKYISTNVYLSIESTDGILFKGAQV